MRKIITFAGIAILFVLLSAPSFVKAAVLGQTYYNIYPNSGIAPVQCQMDFGSISSVTLNNSGAVCIYNSGTLYPLYIVAPNWEGVDTTYNIYPSRSYTAVYLTNFDNTVTLTYNGFSLIVTGDLDTYYDNIPEEYRPVEPTWNQQLWIDFLDFLEFQLGLDPFDGGIWNFFKRYFDDPENETLEITFPTNAPTPTPTPRPTPIPVQTIYVPDGNGSYTIIYQYPDPSGTITQSPYNPNIDVNVDVDCDCDGGSQNYYPQDPMYAPLEGLSWSSPDGDLSGSPAMSASQSLDAIKAEVDSYDEPIKVVSNSFGALPGKWLSLVGLLGACLIVAGLIRTFLGG